MFFALWPDAGVAKRLEALAGRLDRTGKNWSISQYIYSSLGLALAMEAGRLDAPTDLLFIGAGAGISVGFGRLRFG